MADHHPSQNGISGTNLGILGHPHAIDLPMYPKHQRGSNRPKISTMPRQPSEAGQYLTIYKLTIEKNRLSQELANLDQRRQQIQTQLAALDQLIDTSEKQALHLRSLEKPVGNSTIIPVKSASSDSFTSFETLFLEY